MWHSTHLTHIFFLMVVVVLVLLGYHAVLGSSPVALTCVVVLIVLCAWFVRAYFTMTERYLESLDHLPPTDRLRGMEMMILCFPNTLTESHLTAMKIRYKFGMRIVTAVAVIILAALFSYPYPYPARLGDYLLHDQSETASDSHTTSTIVSTVTTVVINIIPQLFL